MKITVMKIGGNVVDNPAALARFIKDISTMPGYKILVHGGGKEATRMSAQLGIETTMIDGRRVTDRPTLDVVTMVYAGLVNKRIVSLLQAHGCDAIGLTGADGNAVRATRRKPNPVDYGYVGDIAPEDVNTHLISALLQAGTLPVFCAIMHDGDGTLLNCNADSVAAAVAKGMSRVAMVDLVYCFEKKGVLENVDDDNSVIPVIDTDLYPKLRADGIIVKGMIPKIDNAFDAINYGVNSVRICHSDDLTNSGGTVIRK